MVHSWKLIANSFVMLTGFLFYSKKNVPRNIRKFYIFRPAADGEYGFMKHIFNVLSNLIKPISINQLISWFQSNLQTFIQIFVKFFYTKIQKLNNKTFFYQTFEISVQPILEPCSILLWFFLLCVCNYKNGQGRRLVT